MNQPTMLTRTDIGDHDLARMLRLRGAINTFRHIGNSTEWRDAQGAIVALVIYHGKTEKTVYISAP